MKKCPKCGNFMIFKMKYSCGYPVIEYRCFCGYSTFNESLRTDSKTNVENDVVDTLTNHT